MPVKKRRLSPSASSASSTPAPPSIPPDSSALPSSSSLAAEGLAGPGPSTLSNQYQSRRERNDAAERRQYARLGVQQPGSGDGEEYGEESFLWADIPVSKGFRYTPCAISPTPSPHPRYPFHRTIPYPPPLPPVHISWLDRSAYMRISPTALTISNDRGFRSARANVAVRDGRWYYEVKIERGDGSSGGGRGHLMSSNPHVRIGWGRREANIDAPVGSDAYSYSIRDVNGEKVHIARPKPYAGRSFSTGDVIGCSITLPKRDSIEDLSKNDPAKIKRPRRQFIYKNQSYFESNEYMPSKEMDSLIDREGKLSAQKNKAANGHGDGNATDGVANGNGDSYGTIPKKGGGKKGATTKNTKKNKNENTSTEDTTHGSRPLKRLEGSRIEFYLNGEHLGVAFEDVYDFIPLPPIHTATTGHGKKSHEDETIHDDGTLGYYPMISCFGKGKAKFNPGPDFDFPPDNLTSPNEGDGPDDQKERVRPICQRWDEFRLEEEKYDEKDEIEGADILKKVLEDEKKAALQYSNSVKRKKGSGGTGTSGQKKKKVDITNSIRGETITPGPGEDEERDRSVSIAPSLINSVPPTRGSSPVSVTAENKIYSEMAEQIVTEDTPQSPAPLEYGHGEVEVDDVKKEKEDPVDDHGVKAEGQEGGEGEDGDEGVKW
ncbi:hypothetical protein I302_105583 [Kwoniella bestiolae CBS 10118]|uniref:B30.2/SPRY domain-containing protein n=1 Tax=Kwoniella bestiolae CBS 10118 TaxID=1296100 RepID=A0A1B9G1J4_9TREE|nr:hypothetical protein I302_04702 [Kwoniella bestiolae CBS 10118]OCF24892.1 hypothetical protein I302_04702 [Kwoniella bestiolae CBS 10118]